MAVKLSWMGEIHLAGRIQKKRQIMFFAHHLEHSEGAHQEIKSRARRCWHGVRSPSAFGVFKFTPPEDPHRKMGVLDDQRGEDQSGVSPAEMSDAPLSDIQRGIEVCWAAQKPMAHMALWPFLKKAILKGAQEGGWGYSDCAVIALDVLISDGNSMDAQYATTGGELWLARGRSTTGARKPKSAARGDRLSCVDYAACEVSFGHLHCGSIDTGVNME